MKKEELFALYEKLYFHETEMREKITARLQLPFAMLVGEIGCLGYMLNNKSDVTFSYYICEFWTFYLLSILILIIAFWFFVKSWYGYKYAFIPSPIDTEGYKKSLELYYEKDKDKDNLVQTDLRNYLYDYYAKCSSINTDNNDKRSLFLYRTSSSIIVSVIFAFLAFIPFYFGEFDKSKKPQKVIIVNPISVSNDSNYLSPHPPPLPIIKETPPNVPSPGNRAGVDKPKKGK
jgi:hypothetical protein